MTGPKQSRPLVTLDPQEVKLALRALSPEQARTINGRLVIRRRAKRGKVGRDEWDVDAERMLLAQALEELLPGDGRCLLKGEV